MLAVFESNVGPIFSTVRGLVHTVTDGHAVAHPTLAASGPNDFGVCWINCKRADGLHVRLIKDGTETAATVDGLPNSAAGGASENSEAAIVIKRRHRRDTSTHGGRTNISGGQTRNAGGIEAYCLALARRRAGAGNGGQQKQQRRRTQ